MFTLFGRQPLGGRPLGPGGGARTGRLEALWPATMRPLGHQLGQFSVCAVLAHTLNPGVSLPDVCVPVSRRLDLLFREDLWVGGQDVGDASPQAVTGQFAATGREVLVSELEHLADHVHPK